MTTSPVMGITDELVAELEAVAHTGKGAFMIECAEVHALLTERAELMRDAERYRHYRQGMVIPELLDSNIDAAMQSEAKP